MMVEAGRDTVEKAEGGQYKPARASVPRKVVERLKLSISTETTGESHGERLGRFKGP